MSEHWLRLHSSGTEYRKQLRQLLDARIDADRGLGLIVRDERFGTIQRMLWSDPLHGAGVRVRSAQAMAERWFDNGRVHRAVMNRDADEFYDTVSTSEGRKVWFQGEVVDVLWQRGQPQQTAELELTWCDWLQDNDVGLLCSYQDHPGLHDSKFGQMATSHTHDGDGPTL